MEPLEVVAAAVVTGQDSPWRTAASGDLEVSSSYM